MEDYEGGDSESADNQTESNGDKKLRKKLKGLKIQESTIEDKYQKFAFAPGIRASNQQPMKKTRSQTRNKIAGSNLTFTSIENIVKNKKS